MTQLVVDAGTVQRLLAAQTTVELVDPAGHLVGHFIPASPGAKEPIISEEELQRRERLGGGRPLAQILADLEKRV
jgi:hypothetical protein